MVRQDAKEITIPWVDQNGCAMLSVMYWANRYKNVSFSPLAIERDYYALREAGGLVVIENEILVSWIQAFKFYGMDVKFVQTEDASDFCIYEWYNERTKLRHFTPGEKGLCLFDPLGFSITVREGIIKSKRCFKLA